MEFVRVGSRYLLGHFSKLRMVVEPVLNMSKWRGKRWVALTCDDDEE